MRYATGLTNIVRSAAVTATNAIASSAFELISRNAAGGGNVSLSGSYTGAADSVVDVEITSNVINGDPQISAPVYSGVGNGTIGGISATSGIAAQQFEITVTDLGTPTRAAFAPFQAGNLFARTTGPAGNDYSVSISQSPLVLAATDYAVTREMGAGASDFAGDEFDFGAVNVEPEGTVPPSAARLRFGDDVTVYRHWREFRQGRYRYMLSPALQRSIPIGTRVFAVTGGRTVTVLNGVAVVETYTAITSLYSLLSVLKADSALIDYAGVIAADRRPGGMACDDLAVYTASYSAGSVRSGTSYIKKAVVPLTVPSAAPTESLSIVCVAAPIPGAEIWAVSSSVTGDLENAITGVAYTDYYGFTVPSQLQPNAEPVGTKSAEFELLPRLATEVLPTLSVRNFRLGAEAISKTYTFEYRPRPAGACDSSSVLVSGGPNEILLGISEEDDAVSTLPAACQDIYKAIQEWRIGSIALNSFMSGRDTEWDLGGQPAFSDGYVRVVTEVTDISLLPDPLPAPTNPPLRAQESFTALQQRCSAVAVFDEQDIRAITAVADIFQKHLLQLHSQLGSPAVLPPLVYSYYEEQFFIMVGFLMPLTVLLNTTGATAWKTYVMEVYQRRPNGERNFAELALEFTAMSVASSRNLTQNLEPLLTLCRARIGGAYVEGGLQHPFDVAGLTGNSVWQDHGGTSWFVSLDGLLPLQPNVYYHSAVMANDSNGTPVPTSTRQFGIGPGIGCVENLKPGDKLIIVTNPFSNGRATYQQGDSITHQIVRADPVALGGGQTGDDTITLSVRGTVIGALAEYSLITTALTSYTNAGMSFAITPGAIGFAPGDQWAFSTEGGEFRWRRDGGSWTTADIDGSVALTAGILANFAVGATPSFVDGDTYQHSASATNGIARAQSPDDESFAWSGSTQIDIAGSGAADTLLIGAHTIASTATILLTGSNDDFSTVAVSLPVVWRAGSIGLLFDSVTCAKWRLAINEGGTIRLLYLGVPARPLLSGSTRARLGIWDQRIRLAGASRGRGIGGRIAYDSCGYDSVISLIDSLEYAQQHEDARVGIVSEELEAGICTLQDEVDLIDRHGNQPVTSLRKLSIAIELNAI